MLTEDDADLGIARYCVEEAFEVVFDSGKLGGMSGRACLWLAIRYWPDEADNESADGQEDRCDAGGQAGRGDFDTRFEAACDELKNSLGTPASRGKYEYRHRAGWPYSYAVWRAERGFLVLQQDESDILFGFDISIWVPAAREGESLPSFPVTAQRPKGDTSVETSTTNLLWDREFDG